MAVSLHPMARRAAGALKSWEFPKKSGIRIREILNATQGDVFGASYLVTIPAKLTGRLRERKQFGTKEEAEDFAEKRLRGARQQGEDFFALTDEERRQVVACLPMLRERGITLSEAVRLAMKHLRPEAMTRTVGEIVAELKASKELRLQRGDLREYSFRDFRHRADRFAQAFAGQIASEVSAEEIKTWLLSLGHRSPRTTRNDIAVLGELFRYAAQKRYVSFSPLDNLSDEDRKVLTGNGSEEGEPAILTPEQAEELLKAALAHPELDLLAAVTLGLFCGLRTEEIKRLDWASVHLYDKHLVVTFGAKIAKKRRIRHVDIPANAVAWLSLIPNREAQVAPNAHTNDFQKRFQRLLKAAGFGAKDEKGIWRATWERNAMRHSFGSYHYALHGNPLETARLLGHKANDQVLFDHYRALATKPQGEAFFAIKPPEPRKS